MTAHQCDHCLLKGHHADVCHVRRDGRSEPDTADRIACEALRGHKHVRPEWRGRLAQILRELAVNDLVQLLKETDNE